MSASPLGNGVVWCQHGGGYEMENIEMNVEGSKLILIVDLTVEIGPSSSGKEGVKVGLNVYKAKKP
jgi:hypothetical protein